MTGCLRRCDGDLRSEFPAYVENGGNLTPSHSGRGPDFERAGVASLFESERLAPYYFSLII
jgi:hypothetical protein